MNSIQTLKNILDALMTISVRGNDTITMSNCMQALQQVIDYMETPPMQVAEPAAAPISIDEVSE